MRYLEIHSQTQCLTVFEDDQAVLSYPVSTAKNGLGQDMSSGQTPRGWHQIRAKIGQGCDPNAVFKNRRPTGEIYRPTDNLIEPQRDWILGRILWLSGLQKGFNRLGKVDTMRRYIYIHGTAHEAQLGQAVSKGCIRMAPAGIIELFSRVAVGDRVLIK